MNPFSPQQLAQLQAMFAQQNHQVMQASLQQAQGAAAQVMQQIGPNMLATLTPPNTERRLLNGIPYEEVPVKDPIPWMPVAENIAWGLNDRVITFTNQTINVEAVGSLGFDLTSNIYALTAAVRTTDGNDISGSYGSVLDLFRVQFELSQGRKWQTANAMGSALLGTAQRPRFLGRPGWRFNNGARLLVNFTPLRSNIQVDIVLWAIEFTGPGNLSMVP